MSIKHHNSRSPVHNRERKPNIIIEGEIAKIELTQGQWAIVDAEDLEKLQAAKCLWSASRQGNTFYARRNIKNKHVYMHQVVMDCIWLDHINHNGLDNRKAILRPSDYTLNGRNKSIQYNRTGYKGVRKVGNSIFAEIKHDGKVKYLGRFQTLEDAARAYNAKAKELFGEWACLNDLS